MYTWVSFDSFTPATILLHLCVFFPNPSDSSPPLAVFPCHLIFMDLKILQLITGYVSMNLIFNFVNFPQLLHNSDQAREPAPPAEQFLFNELIGAQRWWCAPFVWVRSAWFYSLLLCYVKLLYACWFISGCETTSLLVIVKETRTWRQQKRSVSTFCSLLLFA